MKLFGLDVIEVDGMPEHEVIFGQRVSVRLVPSVTTEGEFRLTLVEQVRPLGRIINIGERT